MEMRVVENVPTGQDLNPPLTPLAFVLHDRYLPTHCSACFNKLPDQPFSPHASKYPQNPQHVPNNDAHILYCSPRCSHLDSALHFSSAEAQLHSIFRQSPPSMWRDENSSSDLRLSLRLLRRLTDTGRRNGKYSLLSGINECPLRENVDCEGPDGCFGVFHQNTIISVGILEGQRLLLGGQRTSPLGGGTSNQNSGNFAESRELERIGGLMTNRERLMIKGNVNDGGGGVMKRIRQGVNVMTKARRMYLDADDDHRHHDFMSEDSLFDEMVLCSVMTNAVEVHDESGVSIGVVVYGPTFSWINHSCSPNACYRFLLGVDNSDVNEQNGYGPRVIVRSMKPVKKGEEVTIAYTDLLQPKNMRNAELWLKYRFICSCKRCEAVPASYVDSALQALIVDGPTNPDTILCLDHEAHEKLMNIFDDTISEYLLRNDPKSCITKLENLLSHGKSEDDNSCLTLKLHPFHHISLNAYTTLASAYKVHAVNLLSNDNELNGPRHEAFVMYKTSAAYSLLLALVTNHLFTHEPALVASLTNYWGNAGESLLNLARSSLCDLFLGPCATLEDFSCFLTYKCNHCSLTGTLKPDSMNRGEREFPLEEIKNRLMNCISSLASKAWSTLASGNSLLGSIKDLTDTFLTVDVESHVNKSSSRTESSLLEAEEGCNSQVRVNLVLLGIHCLRYGALFSNICYGSSPQVYYFKRLSSIENSLSL